MTANSPRNYNSKTYVIFICLVTLVEEEFCMLSTLKFEVALEKLTKEFDSGWRNLLREYIVKPPVANQNEGARRGFFLAITELPGKLEAVFIEDNFYIVYGTIFWISYRGFIPVKSSSSLTPLHFLSVFLLAALVFLAVKTLACEFDFVQVLLPSRFASRH
ncbi:hypothetical protein KQX54_015802 [Cotesia glomerata]|uniref:Uncharacterized protein n=1 Tax=Cotesia glomerata TaxID=32391 RepID=A0AAV7ISY3_COTGL|nr:hypothetical protein KQX54_015802 [Cotesia glomerata]